MALVDLPPVTREHHQRKLRIWRCAAEAGGKLEYLGTHELVIEEHELGARLSEVRGCNGRPSPVLDTRPESRWFLPVNGLLYLISKYPHPSSFDDESLHSVIIDGDAPFQVCPHCHTVL